MTAMLLCNDVLVYSNSVLYYLLVSCPSLVNPSNGVVSCSLGDDGVPSYQDTCSFTCDTGYELTGSDTRTCQSNGSWSSSTAMCRRSEWHHTRTTGSIRQGDVIMCITTKLLILHLELSS